MNAKEREELRRLMKETPASTSLEIWVWELDALLADSEALEISRKLVAELDASLSQAQEETKRLRGVIEEMKDEIDDLKTEILERNERP